MSVNKKETLQRAVIFLIGFAYFLALVSIKNHFHWMDEYHFAGWLSQGVEFFMSHHMLSSFSGYVTWWLATLLGFEISAYSALRLFSEIMAAAGLVAALDLGVFWGISLKRMALYLTPIFLSNMIIRFSTSAYPTIGAIGFLLIALSLLARGLKDMRKPHTPLLLWSSFFIGLALNQHAILLFMMPPLGIYLLLYFEQKGIDLDRSANLFLKIFGIGAAISIAGQILFFYLNSKKSIWVHDSYQDMPVSFFSRPPAGALMTCIKTHWALFFPGVHSESHTLEMLFNIPRMAGVGLIGYLVFLLIKNRSKISQLNKRALILCLIGPALIFYAMIYCFPQARQYATLSTPALLAFFFLTFKILIEDLKLVSRVVPALLSICIIFYMIFGIEGLIYLRQVRDPKLAPLFEPEQIFTHKKPPWPMLKPY